MTKARHQVTPQTICLVHNKNKLLLIKFSKDKGPEMAGYYNPPGGHIEKEEGIIENAEKEIEEETGLKVHNTRLRGIIHVTNFTGNDYLLFVTSSTSDSFQCQDNHEGHCEWIDLEQIKKLKIFEDLKIIIQKVQSLDYQEVFTAKSKFDDDGKLLYFDFE